MHEKLRQLGFIYNQSSDTWFYDGDLNIDGDFRFHENFVINGNFYVKGSCLVKNIKIFSDFERIKNISKEITVNDSLPLLKVGQELYVIGNVEAFNISVSGRMEVFGICNAVNISASEFYIHSSISCLSLKNL